MREEYKNFGQEVARLRSRLGLSRRHLARLLDVDHTTVRSWELGVRVPRRETAHTLMELGGIDLMNAYDAAYERRIWGARGHKI